MRASPLMGKLECTSVVIEVRDMLEMQVRGHRDSCEGGGGHHPRDG
jgi:hypothetical protein